MDIIQLSGEGEAHFSTFGLLSIILMTVLGLIALTATFTEHKHWHILSEASVAVFFGMIIGAIYVFSSTDRRLPEFDHTFFFFVLLPIIVFKEGYGLNKRHFFKNLFYVALYGILGTILNFILVALLTYGVSAAKLVYLNDGENIQLDTFWSMYFAACISSKDSAVTLSVLNFDLTPKLNSIIFGEQILNDLVVFSLQKAVETIGGEDDEIVSQWYTSFEFLGIIIEQLVVSLLVGIVIGILATWITKKCRFITHHSSILTALTVYAAYLSFALCEAFHYCGVVAVLVCGVILSHYMTYNLPKICSDSSKITVKALAYVSETYIYFYIGFTLWVTFQYKKDSDPYQSKGMITGDDFMPLSLVGFEVLLIIPIARFLSLILTHGFAILFRIKTSGKWRINRYEFFIIFYTGLIRGVVAYALIMEKSLTPCDEDSDDYFSCQEKNNSLLYVQNTALLVVLFNTVFLGGSLKWVCELSFKAMEKNSNARETFLPPESGASFFESSGLAQSQFICLLQDAEKYKNQKPKSETFFKRFDEKYLKAFLIYDYHNRKEDLKLAKKRENKKEHEEQHKNERMIDDSIREQRTGIKENGHGHGHANHNDKQQNSDHEYNEHDTEIKIVKQQSQDKSDQHASPKKSNKFENNGEQYELSVK